MILSYLIFRLLLLRSASATFECFRSFFFHLSALWPRHFRAYFPSFAISALGLADSCSAKGLNYIYLLRIKELHCTIHNRMPCAEGKINDAGVIILTPSVLTHVDFSRDILGSVCTCLLLWENVGDGYDCGVMSYVLSRMTFA